MLLGKGKIWARARGWARAEAGAVIKAALSVLADFVFVQNAVQKSHTREE